MYIQVGRAVVDNGVVVEKCCVDRLRFGVKTGDGGGVRSGSLEGLMGGQGEVGSRTKGCVCGKMVLRECAVLGTAGNRIAGLGGSGP